MLEIEQERQKQKFEKHAMKKTKAWENKNADKLLSSTNNNLSVLCFDLEQVLMCPKLKHLLHIIRENLITIILLFMNFPAKQAIHIFGMKPQLSKAAVR